MKSLLTLHEHKSLGGGRFIKELAGGGKHRNQLLPRAVDSIRERRMAISRSASSWARRFFSSSAARRLSRVAHCSCSDSDRTRLPPVEPLEPRWCRLREPVVAAPPMAEADEELPRLFELFEFLLPVTLPKAPRSLLLGES